MTEPETPPLQFPQTGGSYERLKDGSLRRLQPEGEPPAAPVPEKPATTKKGA